MQASLAVRSIDAKPEPGRPARVLSNAERGIMLAVIYADVFDFALTHQELFERVVHIRLDRGTFESSLRALSRDLLNDTENFVCLRGRESLVALRAEREARGDRLWPHAQRFGRWFWWIPFVRSVAVSGSLAAGNAGKKSDIDLFCITAENRLWISRLFFVTASKATRLFPHLFPVYVCPNYVIDEASLTVTDQHLFTAHEVTQAVPLWGFDAHRAFLSANAWTSSLLPNVGKRPNARPSTRRPLLTRLVERLLGGRFGDFLNGASYRLFTRMYRRRAYRRGWDWSKLAPAYQIGRYTVPEGGYVRVVTRLFRERLRSIDAETGLECADIFLPDYPQATSVHDWPALFAQDYGSTA